MMKARRGRRDVPTCAAPIGPPKAAPGGGTIPHHLAMGAVPPNQFSERLFSGSIYHRYLSVVIRREGVEVIGLHEAAEQLGL